MRVCVCVYFANKKDDHSSIKISFNTLAKKPHETTPTTTNNVNT